MKQQVMYIHGGSAFSKYENYLEYLRTTKIDPHPAERPQRWADTLAEDLGEEYEVFKPTMPNKYCSKYEEWKLWFERHFEFLRDDLILIGWSQGGMFLLRYLSENNLPFSVKALYVLASPLEAIDYEGDDGGDFYADPALLEKVAEQVGRVTVMHSEDDFVVPYEQGQKLAAALLGAEFLSYPDKNHFLVEELTELVAHIKTL